MRCTIAEEERHQAQRLLASVGLWFVRSDVVDVATQPVDVLADVAPLCLQVPNLLVQLTFPREQRREAHLRGDRVPCVLHIHKNVRPVSVLCRPSSASSGRI